MKISFYINTSTLLYSHTFLAFPLLYNKDIIINLYKLHFPSSHFSLQSNKKVFLPSHFYTPPTKHTRENQIFSILPLFHPPINFSSSHFSIPPTKRTLNVTTTIKYCSMSVGHRKFHVIISKSNSN